MGVCIGEHDPSSSHSPCCWLSFMLVCEDTNIGYVMTRYTLRNEVMVTQILANWVMLIDFR